jgi:glycosyltransferase involved in cell wall biosynthesis
MVLGLRGFPRIQGGVETHSEQIFPLVAEGGFRVTAITRSRYLRPDHPPSWKGVELVRVWSPKSKSLEAVVHSFLGVLYAGLTRPDILHIQAIGPALVTPLARFLGLRVVVTHHGPDYDRQKWGKLAKMVLRFSEAMGMRFANRRIVISETIRKLVTDKYGVDVDVIRNGVNLSPVPASVGALDAFGLVPERYVLLVSRLVPEKRHMDLIEAFVRLNLDGWKLVLVGNSDHPDAYSNSVIERAAKSPNVVMTGFQTGLALQELYGHAGLFVLPSSHEGLPIALLEALSYGLAVVASDIPANLEVGLPLPHYFPLGDVGELENRIKDFAARARSAEERESTRQWVLAHYNWRDIALQTISVYSSMLGIAQQRRIPA